MTTPAKQLQQRIKSREATVGVVGLGYVGLPLSIGFARAGFPVLGFDTDSQRVAQVNDGEQVMQHIPRKAMRELAQGGEATADFARLGEADAVLICVPTPLDQHHQPDMSYVEAAADAIAATLRKGQLVALESTTWPGTTRELLLPRLEASGLRAGEDFFLVYSPEREDPGNANYGIGDIPKVVGGHTDACRDVAVALYESVVSRTIPVSSPETAEATKLMENIFRAVNITMVNELKLVLDRMDVNIWEVVDAAATKPFGFMPFYPGPGMGGHCIPVDPFYLAWRAKEFNTTARFIELAGELNMAMTEHVGHRLLRTLNDDGKAIRGSRIMLLGVAYKRNIDDTRESPAGRLLELLEVKGARVSYHDPFVAEYRGCKSTPLTAKALRDCDAVLVVTDHDDVDYALVGEHVPLVVDTRNVMASLGDVKARVVRA
ncbi:MAG: nucleotide sugar dehydrogenase [Candidatus Poseidoniia archaeon]|nr:nucleotide sugar dehydrogenase [Candidatus Poseidoniia archaeon]